MRNRLKKSELRTIVNSYSDLFEGWNRNSDGSGFFRISGPILQLIWFQALSTGDYRPETAVVILVCPDGAMLSQQLDVRHRQIGLRAHERMLPRVREAIREQFQPAIDSSLDPNEVLQFCLDSSVKDRIGDIASIASLAAYLGNRPLALSWCEKKDDAIKKWGNDQSDCIQRDLGFIVRLQQALFANEEQDLLGSLMKERLDAFRRKL